MEDLVEAVRTKSSLPIKQKCTDEVTMYVPKYIGLLVNGGMLMIQPKVYPFLTGIVRTHYCQHRDRTSIDRRIA